MEYKCSIAPNVPYNLSFFNGLNLKTYKMKMSEKQIRAIVIMNIIDNCTMELDNTGQERYSLNEKQFGDVVETLVKNIKVIQC